MINQVTLVGRLTKALLKKDMKRKKNLKTHRIAVLNSFFVSEKMLKKVCL